MKRRPPSRRDFLQGKAAARAVGDLLEPSSSRSDTAESRAANLLVQVSRNAMATEFQVLLDAQKHPAGPDAAMEALDRIEALEGQLSVYRPRSEVSRLNAQAHEVATPVEAGLFELLATGKRLWAETGGAFDMTAGPLSRVWGFHERRGRWPEAEELRETLATIGSDALELDEKRQTVRFTRPGCEINLGAIGKGWALDQAAEHLEWEDVDDFLLHGGRSSVLARGTRHGQEGWSIGLMHPLRPQQRLGALLLRDMAVGTSGCGNQFFHHQGRRLGHILDPRNGLPAESVLSATVLSSSATEADALATAVYVMGPQQTQRLLEKRPDLGVILVTSGTRRAAIEIHPLNLPPDCWQPESGAAKIVGE